MIRHLCLRCGKTDFATTSFWTGAEIQAVLKGAERLEGSWEDVLEGNGSPGGLAPPKGYLRYAGRRGCRFPERRDVQIFQPPMPRVRQISETRIVSTRSGAMNFTMTA